jgi:DNA-binding GntR family transcriptional regulator
MPSHLHKELAQRIRSHLTESGAAAGLRLVEEDLCRRFGVSRTPVRGALKLLAEDGTLKARPGRGYVLVAPPTPVSISSPGASGAGEPVEKTALFEAMAEARWQGTLPDYFTQQEILRRFAVPMHTAVRVLNRLEDIGLIVRRAGYGWSFTGEIDQALQEGYAFRRALEPALLLLPSFRLDQKWARISRQTHMKLRDKVWRPGDGAIFHTLNGDFHAQLARCCANRHMQRAMEKQIALRHFLSRRWDYPARQIRSAIDEHLEILTALEQGYADKASALMRHHLTQSAAGHNAEGVRTAAAD